MAAGSEDMVSVRSIATRSGNNERCKKMPDRLSFAVPDTELEYHPISFVLVSTGCGSMIINRHDHHREHEDGGQFGVGYELLETGRFCTMETELYKRILNIARRTRGDGVVAMDVGANIGAITVPLARHMRGWGQIMAFERQRRLFYALAGNIALGNSFNADAFNVAVGARAGSINVPGLDYERAASYGSLELIEDGQADVGQKPDYEHSIS